MRNPRSKRFLLVLVMCVITFALGTFSAWMADVNAAPDAAVEEMENVGDDPAADIALAVQFLKERI